MSVRVALLLGMTGLFAGCVPAHLSSLVAPAEPAPPPQKVEPAPTLDLRGWRIADLSHLDRATSPSHPKPARAAATAQRSVFRIPFASGRQTLGPKGRAAVARVVEAMRDGRTVSLRGMTDDWGSEAFRDRLAFGRATAVRAALMTAGVPASRVRVLGRVTGEHARAVVVTSEDSHGR